MDVAYDHIQKDALDPSEQPEGNTETPRANTTSNLNTEFSQAFKAVSSSPWGAKLNGWFSQAVEQSSTFYQDLSKEVSETSTQASKGLSRVAEEVANRTAALKLDSTAPGPEVRVPGEEAVPGVTFVEAEGEGSSQERSENLSADIVKEAGSLVASFRSTAAARLKDLQKAEDAADEALLKFGTNIRSFLRDAVSITAPEDGDGKTALGTDGVGNEVLFETQESGTGKKVFHTTRLDAQLHAIHSSAGSFTDEPQGQEWEEWEKTFDVEARTAEIAKDLEKFEELRRAMERLVPEKVDYKTFWLRYYFLRRAVEEDEKRRREVLKGATADPEEEVAWDDDDDEEDDKSATPNKISSVSHKASASTTTITAPTTTDNATLKPISPRRSDEENRSVADSEASYDLVSGATSRAQGSPKEAKTEGKDESDDDDDWE
ncbi:unnamed protein product [Zymoseptoria tritici ST99CH_3D1]|uniref:BSD domain-containing protein n=1 Tax=Zymoseptoria tritici (strain CBS 115943 / IPO323) TaxID=336722 RepID=F9X907_ZYMTI|nr:uncharacterized protein MYCGRDRAFT_99952 [Zymoseptoria tritici IPO323]EGP88007.1 hypothetical protein MYCGRDRAFT_99952 [Zymoseptoria tritici IPO323]SMR51950.1 unnamed protein product [Zymoseptoria tritici ST99CH_3D1]